MYCNLANKFSALSKDKINFLYYAHFRLFLGPTVLRHYAQIMVGQSTKTGIFTMESPHTYLEPQCHNCTKELN